MKLIVLLTLVACSCGDKLDKTYLPPHHAQTSGGLDGFLQTPVSGSSSVEANSAFSQRNQASTYNGPNGNSQQENGFVRNSAFDYNGNTGDLNAANNVGANFNGFEQRTERAQAAFERNAAILRQSNENDGEKYAYAYETENGIYAEESGVATNGVMAQGGFSYIGDDGQQYSIRYTADENGFQPQGDHLPTSPPIPEEILKALEQNARDEANGIFDDGSYHEGKYGNEINNEYNSNAAAFGNNFNGAVNNIKQDQVSNDEDTVVTNAVPEPEFQRPGFRNSGVLGNQNGFNQEAASDGVNKAYLPPVNRRISDNRFTQAGRTDFGSRNRQPSFNSRNGYQY